MAKSCNLVASNLQVSQLVDQLRVADHLWGDIAYRQAPQSDIKSPHRDSSDIHLRYNPISRASQPDFHTSPHIPEWYPAIAYLPHVIPITAAVIQLVCAEMLGSVFAIKVPKGQRIHPHIDHSWNSTYFHKFCIGIQNKDEKGVCGFDDGSSFAPADGSVWQFENDVVHWFDNTQGEDDAIMLIVNCRPILSGVVADAHTQKAA